MEQIYVLFTVNQLIVTPLLLQKYKYIKKPPKLGGFN